MALADAIALIAEQMDEEAEDPSLKDCLHTLRGYARQLRTAIKAAEGVKDAAPYATPNMQHHLEIEKAKLELREQRQKATF